MDEFLEVDLEGFGLFSRTNELCSCDVPQLNVSSLTGVLFLKCFCPLIKVMEYEYEADMEETYRTSMFKTFKKTLDDGFFPFIILDAINDRVRHFEQFWSAAKTKGFEVMETQNYLNPLAFLGFWRQSPTHRQDKCCSLRLQIYLS